VAPPASECEKKTRDKIREKSASQRGQYVKAVREDTQGECPKIIGRGGVPSSMQKKTIRSWYPFDQKDVMVDGARYECSKKRNFEGAGNKPAYSN